MTDARKDFCDRCGFNVLIFHIGQVPRTPPHNGFKQVQYCKPCYDVIGSGQAVADMIMDKGAVPDPSEELQLMKFRIKMRWSATGLVMGILVGFAIMLLIFLRGGTP